MPEDPAAEAAAAAAAPPATAAKQASPADGCGGATAPRPSGGPGRRTERPDDLLPELLSFVQAEPRLTKDKVGGGRLQRKALKLASMVDGSS